VGRPEAAVTADKYRVPMPPPDQDGQWVYDKREAAMMYEEWG
jgi:hypothetical protein